MKKNSGFTLIELLVVVAIIGILAAIILVSISSSRNKGADGGIKKQVLEARSQAELHFANNGNSYINVCTSGANNIATMFTKLAALSGTTEAVNSGAVQTATTLNCNTSISGYALSVKLKAPASTTYLCIDSANANEMTATPLPANQITCP